MSAFPILPNPKGKKYPVLAAVLNFFVPGFGYAYNAQRNLFAFLLLVGTVTGWTVTGIALQMGLEVEIDTSAWPQPLWLLGEATFFLVSIAFGYDAYKEAEKANKKNGHK